MIRAVFFASNDAAPRRFVRLRQSAGVAAQFIFGGALFLLALLGVSRVLDGLLPPLAVPIVDEKLKFFREHADEFDTLFFGSSRTYHQLLPATFDEATAAQGVPTKSFNFGVDGLFPPEDGYVAEQLFAYRPTKLRRVFIEISYFRNHWIGMDPDSIRALYWHDAPRFWQSCQDLLMPYDPSRLTAAKPAAPPKKAKPFRWKNWRKEWAKTRKDWGKKWERMTGRFDFKIGQAKSTNVLTHARLFLRRTFNAGRGADLVLALSRGTQRQLDWSALGSDYLGAKPIPRPKQIAPAILEKFDRLAEKVRVEPNMILPFSLAQGANTRRIIELVRAAGAEPILFIAPDVQPCRRFLPEDPNFPTFDFTDIHRWPALFRRENRIDSSHLDRDGSLEFTRAFAQMFLDHEAQKRLP